MAYNAGYSQLSAGCIRQMVNGNTPSQPVVQILSVGDATTQSGGKRRRLVVSDGEQSTELMCGQQLDNVNLPVNSIIRLTGYNVTRVSMRLMIILLKVETLSGPVNVIGNPTPATGGDTKPTMGRPTPGFGGSMGASSGARTQITALNRLTPYIGSNWTIKVRCTSKGEIRKFTGRNGESNLFGVTIIDQSGTEMRATCFNQDVDKFYPILQAGKVFFITNGQVKTANKRFTKADYEITLGSRTVIEPAGEDPTIGLQKYVFTKIGDLENAQANAFVDVIGIVERVDDVTSVVARSTGNNLSKRDITLRDDTGRSIRLTTWGKEAENFMAPRDKCVMAAKNVRVSEFSGRSLSTVSSSVVTFDPQNLEEATVLQRWYDSQGKNSEAVAFSNMSGAGGGRTYSRKLLVAIKEEGMGHGEMADMFSCRAYVAEILKPREGGNDWYQACPTPQCNRKVTEENGQYRCDKCNQTFSECDYRYILRARISDPTGQCMATLFNDQAQTLFGEPASTLALQKDTDPNLFEARRVQLCSEKIFSQYVFTFRVRSEEYNDQARLRLTVTSMAPVDYKREGQQVITEIKSLLQGSA